MKIKKPSLVIILLSCLWLLSNSIAWAAPTPEASEEQKLTEQENIRELDAIPVKPPPKEKTLSIKTGGWFTSLFRYYQNTDNDAGIEDTEAWSLYEDLRLWSQITYKKDYTMYVRLKELYVRRNLGSRSTSRERDHDGVKLDMGYVHISKPNWRMPFDLTLGRQYLFVGRGITYSDVNYGIKYKTNFGRQIFLKTFYSMSDKRSYNIDVSIPHYDKNNSRSYAGIEIAYAGMRNKIAYGYFLLEKDFTQPYPPETPAQNYRYNAQYYGLGLQGNAQKSRLGYWLELIKENGRDYTDTSQVALEKERINSLALDIGANYKFKAPLHPALELEFAYGSGDKNRSSVTDTRLGGNTSGDDTNFSYFGSFFAGYALAPRLSNMYIYKIDGSFRPFEKFKFGRSIVCGAKYFRYLKDKKTGGIYDDDATVSSIDIGQEADAYLYWQIGKHIFWSNRFGAFFPGAAYPTTTNNNTRYYYTRLSITF